MEPLRALAVSVMFGLGCLPVQPRQVVVSNAELDRLSVLPHAQVQRDADGHVFAVRITSRQRGMMKGANWGAGLGALVGAIASAFVVAGIPGNRSGDCPSDRDCDFQKMMVPIIFTGLIGLPFGALVGGGIGAAVGAEIDAH